MHKYPDVAEVDSILAGKHDAIYNHQLTMMYAQSVSKQQDVELLLIINES